MSWSKLFGASSSNGVTESSALLSATHDNDGHATSAGTSLQQQSNDDDDDVPTTSVELFFDLVVAAALNSLSNLLLVSNDDGANPTLNDWLWYVLRVFFAFNMWHSCMILNGLLDMYGDVKSAETWIYVITFGFIFLVAALVRTAQNHHNVASALVYVVGRLVVIAVGNFMSLYGEKRPGISDASYKHFCRAVKLSSVLVPLLECMPIVIAIVFFRNSPHGLLIAGYTTAAFFFLWRRVFARQIDDIPSSNMRNSSREQRIANLNHIRERYEVITLVVLGMLCIFDQTQQSTYYIALCSLVTGMSAFLLYFRCRVWERSGSWMVSAESSILYPNLHIVLFCVIPSMGVTFNEIVVEQESTSGELEWHLNPHVLLCYFGAVFLVMLGAMDTLAKDPTVESKRPRVDQRYRVALYFLGGVMLCTCAQFSVIYNHSEVVVPVLFAVLARVEIWATATN